MYIEYEDGKYVVYTESGHVLATRRTEKEAERFKKESQNSRRNNNERRNERKTYAMRSDD